MSSVPSIRVRCLSEYQEDPAGKFVLYWMVAARRVRYNFALQHAADRAEELGIPLLILEPLRQDYRWASERFHRFVVDGMLDNERMLADQPCTYYPYVEPEKGHARGLLNALSLHAALVVSDDSPMFFLPRARATFAEQASSADNKTRFEVVDGNGIYPIRATDRIFTTAASFRRHLQKEIPEHLADSPLENPLANRNLPVLRGVPTSIGKRWPRTKLASSALTTIMSGLECAVSPVERKGGASAAAISLERFLENAFPRYIELRNQPEAECQSFLSPYLHFGHISSHEIFLKVVGSEDWSPARIADKATGSRAGWWGASEPVEAFLDQLITWREIGLNKATHQENYREYESLPDWAQTSLEQHANDPREYLYSLEEFESAATHDSLWNAAQNQLVREGIIHNYMRMLWGKKILEWTPSPRKALAVMIELNNKYALDGRDPNSYSGIFWTLGRYDRAWGPERPIFGKIRFMSSANTARKLKVGRYVDKYHV